MELREVKNEICQIEKRISAIKSSQQFAKEQLQKLEKRLHELYVTENHMEEYYAGIL